MFCRLGGRTVTTTLRPRSGKEYYKIDRSVLVEQQNRNNLTSSSSGNYANITPVLEKSESPSPGYMSSSPFEQPQPAREHFLFPEVSTIVQIVITNYSINFYFHFRKLETINQY